MASSLDQDIFSCDQVAKMLADKATPDFNLKAQLWYNARANDQDGREHLCLLLRTQFGLEIDENAGRTFSAHHWDDDDGPLFHDCGAGSRQHGRFQRALVRPILKRSTCQAPC